MGLWSMTGASRAGAINPTDRVAGNPGVTYFDLVKQVVTDLDSLPAHGEPTAHTIVPYRHIEGDKAKTVPAGPVAIQLLTALTIRAQGKSRLALMADLGPSNGDVTEFTLLALFDLTDQPKLLDLVEVGGDRLTGFTDKPLLPLGRGSDLIVIDSDHFNSNEDFVGTEFLFVRNDRFRLVGSLFTFDERICTSVRTQSLIFTTHRDAGRLYRRVRVAVRETLTLQADSADCSGDKIPRPFTRTFHETYRWSTRRHRYEVISSDLNRLERENDRLISGSS